MIDLAATYTQYRPAIYRYIACRVGDTELAKDLCSEVFLRMVKDMHRYEDRGWPLSAWLYRIAHDRIVDALRMRHNRATVELRSYLSTGEGPDVRALAKLDRDELYSAVNSLPAAQRTVITLRYFREMPIVDVAFVLRRTDGAVKQLQHRGLLGLERRLARSRA